jgi:hypothetical protein
MQCEVTITRHRGVVLSPEQKAVMPRHVGELVIRQERDEYRRRVAYVARLWTAAALGKKGSTRLPEREVIHALYDAQLLYMKGGKFILAGVERSSARPCEEYAQSWVCSLSE